jgi:predicted DNA-binding protein with PD1-like motif
MELLPIRLLPGVDLRGALEEAVAGLGHDSAFVIAGIGSLIDAQLRFAGQARETRIAGPLEIVSVSGSLSPSGSHLHMCVADVSGKVYGGHVGHGNAIRTTAEILVAPLKEWSLSRERDPATGFDELVVRRRV